MKIVVIRSITRFKFNANNVEVRRVSRLSYRLSIYIIDYSTKSSPLRNTLESSVYDGNAR